MAKVVASCDLGMLALMGRFGGGGVSSVVGMFGEQGVQNAKCMRVVDGGVLGGGGDIMGAVKF